MSYEQKDEKFTLHFLDCDCTCCGIRQRHIPSIACNNNDQTQFQQIVNDLSKPRYGLDCNCLCGGKSQLNNKIDPCACPMANATTTPIQVNFSVDTGVKQSSNVPLSLKIKE